MLVSVPLFVVGLLVCIIWSQMLAQFTALIRWRYEELRSMEQTLPESHQMMTQEWEHFFKPNQRNERFGFSRLEARLPQMFLFLYSVYGVGMVLATAAGWR